MIERRRASNTIVLCLEYIPTVLHDWLDDDVKKIDMYLEQITKTIDFLGSHKIIHFDAHDNNILTDGKRIYLSDFGLVLDNEFALTDKERTFFDNNSYYDYGHIYSNIINYLMGKIFSEFSDEKKLEYKIDRNNKVELISNVYNRLDDICKEFNLKRSYVDKLRQYKLILIPYTRFMSEIRKNNKKDTIFPNDEIKYGLDTLHR